MDFQRIDKLMENIKKLQDEKELYLERIEKLEEKRPTITDVVYKKIRNDYDKKLETLNAEIYPLVEQLAVEKSELESRLYEIEDELSDINIKKEEIQVRCDLGEFSQEKADEMIKALDDENKERFEMYNKLKEYSEKMNNVLTKNVLLDESKSPYYNEEEEEEENKNVEDLTAPDIEDIKDVTASDFEDSFETKTGLDTVSGDVYDSEGDGTVFDPSAFETPEDEGKTMLIRHPRLEVLTGTLKGTEYRLKLGTTDIGNDESNDIIIESPSVEFKHAQIVFEPEGFKLYDFNSEKGVFVNGVRVREKVLVKGDVIKLGEIELLFKE